VLSYTLSEQKRIRSRQIENKRYCLPTISSTFHGRDIFAPAAAHLSRGISLSSLGPLLKDFIKLAWPRVKRSLRRVTGKVVYIDRFGNLITNIASTDLPVRSQRNLKASLKRKCIPFRSYYCEVPEGKPLALMGSCGLLEISVNCGNAACDLKASVGDKVSVLNVP
jgi:S-adenosylmethionine hydrolase